MTACKSIGGSIFGDGGVTADLAAFVISKTASSLFCVGSGKSNVVHWVLRGKRAQKNPRPLTPALAWRSSRIPWRKS